jgi:transposase-like protein
MSVNEGSYEARRSALPDRVEVRVWSERRRAWSDGGRLAIVRETLAPGAVAQVVAERHGIGTGLLYSKREPTSTVDGAGMAVQAALAARASL